MTGRVQETCSERLNVVERDSNEDAASSSQVWQTDADMEQEYEESRRSKERTRIFKLQTVEETRSVHGGKLRIRRR